MPEPTADNKLEHFGEFLKNIERVCKQINNSYNAFSKLKRALRDFFNNYQVGYLYTKKDFSISLANLIVQIVALAYMRGIDIEEALNEVNRSNWSKFIDSKHVFDKNYEPMDGE